MWALLERGVGHAQVRRAIERLRAYGGWPLSDAPLATTTGRGRPRVVLREHDAAYVLSPRLAADGRRPRARRRAAAAAAHASRLRRPQLAWAAWTVAERCC